MTDDQRLLVEQDETIAKVAETAMRMMAGAVGPATLRTIRDEVRAHPDSYPWQQVCEVVVREAADPSDLVNRAIVAQRDWVQRGPRGAAPAGTATRPKSPSSNLGKRLLAMLIVRGTFYAVIVLALTVILVLLERKWGLDIYQAGHSIEDFVRGLFG